MGTAAAYGEYIAGKFRQQQHKYRQRMRESDRVLIEIVRGHLAKKSPAAAGRASILDIGCAGGNLLRHLRRALPGARLTGADVFAEVIDQCRTDPDLGGIDFEVMDLLDRGIAARKRFDVAIVNAVLFYFDDTQLESAVSNLAALLPRGGALVGYDLFHPFQQRLEITEVTADHPEGLTLRFRPIADVREAFERHGLGRAEFNPFDIPIDLPPSGDPADVFSRTVREDSGRRMIFRGALHTPWCHFVAERMSP